MTVDRSAFVDDSGETRFAGTIQPGVGTTAGDVLTSQGDGLPSEWAAGGGSSASVRILGPFPIAFDTPDLENGVPIWTPAIGDLILDAFANITEAWDGTTPVGDFGLTANAPWYGYAYSQSLDMTLASYTNKTGLTRLANNPLSTLDAVGQAFDLLYVPAISETPSPEQTLIPQSDLSLSAPTIPIIITTALPVLFCVSQTNPFSHAIPAGVSQGAADVYLKVCTPALT